MRAWIVALLLGLSALGLAGPAKESINFWAVTGSVLDVRMYRGLADRFEAKTGIHVNVTPLAWGSFATKYFAAMAAGLPPDIGVTNLGGPFDYGAVGGVVDLRTEFPEETKRLEAKFPPGLLTIFAAGERLYGIPHDLSTMIMFYRTDVFRRLGLQPPATWSELNRVIDVLEANRYRYYFGFPAYAQWAIGLYTQPYGLTGFKLETDGTLKVNWTQPRYLDGVHQAMRLWHTHNSPGKDLSSRVIGMFRSNDRSLAVPLFFELHTNFDSIRLTAPEVAGKWDIAPWPRADDGKAFNIMGGTAYVVFRKSAKKRQAMRWLEYMNSMEAQQAMTLDRMSRGEQSNMAISPLREFWGPSNAAFWRRAEFKGSQRLIEVLRKTYASFDTAPSINGAAEANRLEANLLDQMQTFIRDRQDALAARLGTTRTKMIEAMGAGRYAKERQALDNAIRSKLESSYRDIAPKAKAIVEKETARYETRFGNVVRDLPDYERRSSVLDVVKWSAVGLLGVALFMVGLAPRLRKHGWSYLFIAAPVVLAVVFVFVPAVTALYLSFTEYHPVLPLSTASWTGAHNYVQAKESGDLGSATFRSAYYALLTVPIGIMISLFFAYLLYGKPRGEKFWRFLYFSPLVTSVVSIALIFSQLFLSGPQGWLNAALMNLGVLKDPAPFLQSEKTFLQCVIVLAIWHGLAFNVLIFVAGLQQIPAQLFEAAEVDGAGAVRRFWNIALPGIRPQVFFISVLGLIGAFQVFEPIYMMANKSGDAGARFGPNDSALTLVPLIYHNGFETYEMGKSAAIAYVMFAMILVLTAVQFRVYRRRGGEGE
ncbi:MAG: extracellular solute-binding protein [Armatimonadetes bacterium]|nr:extracellular solute-binding protein [Armatimonadota bacterium]